MHETIFSLEIINILGEKIYSSQTIPIAIGTNKSEIDLSNQPQGIYFIKVISEKGTTVKKLIKE